MNTNGDMSKRNKKVLLLPIVGCLFVCLWVCWPLFLPVFILTLLGAAFLAIRDYLNMKKEYRKSAFYENFKKAFNRSIIVDPVYRFYNGAAARNLPIRFPESLDDRADGLSYFFYGDTMYLFPNFKQMRLSEDGRAVWQINYEKVWVDFGGVYDTMRSKAMYPGQTVKFLVERSMMPPSDLTKTPPPSCVHVIHSYETAFENDDTALTLRIPQSSEDLYDMMCATPDLCGEFELAEDGIHIRWRIREDIHITLLIHAGIGFVGVEQVQFAKMKGEIANWNCTVFEMYDEVCKIGRRGNVLVLRKRAGRDAVLYSGSKDGCPYQPDRKVLGGKYYYIEAK